MARAARRAMSRTFSSSGSSRNAQFLRPAFLVAVPVVGYLGYHYQTSRAFAQETVELIKEEDIPTREIKLLDINDKEEQPQVSEEETPSEQKEAKGAFDPESGEINWDCPCLGGMADGPCGEEFKAAFSCFVYSEAEPKGVDCIEKFQHMQNCFRKYPDIYSEELREDSPIDEPEMAETVEVTEVIETASPETVIVDEEVTPETQSVHTKDA